MPHCNTQLVRLLQYPPRHVRSPASGDHCTGANGKKAEWTRLHPEWNKAWTVDTWVACNNLFSCCWQLWGKKHWRRACSAPPTNSANILYVLVQKGRGKILRTHHQVRLCRQEGAPLNAIIRQEGIKTISTSPTYCTAGSAASAHQKRCMAQKSSWQTHLTLPHPLIKQ